MVITNHVTHALRTIAAPVAPFMQTESALWVVLTGMITKRDVCGAATHALVNIDGNKCTSPPLVCLYVHVLFFYIYDTPRFSFQWYKFNTIIIKLDSYINKANTSMLISQVSCTGIFTYPVIYHSFVAIEWYNFNTIVINLNNYIIIVNTSNILTNKVF